MKLFAERGYHATTLADVGREIGATKGLVYHYVKSKAELAGQSVIAGFSALKPLEEIAVADIPPSEKLRRAIESFVRAILFDYQRYQVIFTNRAEPIPEVDALIGDERRRLRSRFFRLYVNIIKEGISSGEFAEFDARIAAHTVIEGILGIAYWTDTSISREETLRQVTEMLARTVVLTAAPKTFHLRTLVNRQVSRTGNGSRLGNARQFGAIPPGT